MIFIGVKEISMQSIPFFMPFSGGVSYRTNKNKIIITRDNGKLKTILVDEKDMNRVENILTTYLKYI